MSASTRPLLDTSRVYREARARYALAFERGNVRDIEDAFSRMQEIGRAFGDGVRWAEQKIGRNEGMSR